MLTVACVFVRGPYPYTADYVRRLGQMVDRWVDESHRFVCLTDQPSTVKDYVDRVIVLPAGEPPADGYWSKVELFNPSHAFEDRVLYLDLDSLIVAPLGPIVRYPAPFALTADALVDERKHLATDRYGRRLVRRYNSSVMVWDAGVPERLYTTWTPAEAERLSTDQDWIGEQWPDAAAMPYDWFPRISQVSPPWPKEAKVVLVKKPKNHEAAERWPWFEAMWGAA
jgi:hypothetical protein